MNLGVDVGLKLEGLLTSKPDGATVRGMETAVTLREKR